MSKQNVLDVIKFWFDCNAGFKHLPDNTPINQTDLGIELTIGDMRKLLNPWQPIDKFPCVDFDDGEGNYLPYPKYIFLDKEGWSFPAHAGWDFEGEFSLCNFDGDNADLSQFMYFCELPPLLEKE